MAAITVGSRPVAPPARLVPHRVTSPVFTGRRAELAWLGAGLARVAGGEPATLLIGGEAGVGKSRLVREFAMTAGGNARVLIGRCPELGAVGLPFAPFTAVLRRLMRDPAAAELICPPGSELTRLLPELGPPAVAGTTREARARLFVQLLSLLEQLGSQRPVVLVVEDAHWADESTRALLSFLADNQRATSGVMIVLTYRPDELHRGHPLCGLLASLDRLGWAERTELARLSRDETAELTSHLLGAPVGPALAARVYGRTRGHPLFTEQLLAAGELPRGRRAGPRDLLLDAIARLPEGTQEVLRAASAAGQQTSRGLLAAVTGLAGPDLDARLAPARAAGVLTAAPDRCAFRHALISEALHADLLPGEHTALHRRFATALHHDPSLAPAGSAAIEEAEHWQHAHDPARALASAWAAASAAARALGSAEQLALLVRVLELWGSVPGAHRLTGTDHGDVLHQAAQAASIAGDTQLSGTLAAAARAEAYVDIDSERAARLLRRPRARTRRHGAGTW